MITITIEIEEDEALYQVVKELEAFYNRTPEWLVEVGLNNLHIRQFPEQYPCLFE